MRIKAILGFILLVFFFGVGGVYIAVTNARVINNLENVLALHQMEFLRDNLFNKIKIIQPDLYLTTTPHRTNIGDFVEHGEALRLAGESCFGCHHTEPTMHRLIHLRQGIDEYLKKASRMYTFSADHAQRKREEENASASGMRLLEEIDRCSELLTRITGNCPVGFRAPSFDINASIIDLLETRSFQYDSSCFYSILTQGMRLYHRFLKKGDSASRYGASPKRMPSAPYFPSRENCFRQGSLRRLLEIPMPRSRFSLPFYNNFHLLMPLVLYRLDLSLPPTAPFPYLFHLVEFCDSRDSCVPPALRIHPNLQTSFEEKRARMRNSILFLKSKRPVLRTCDYVNNFRRKGE